MAQSRQRLLGRPYTANPEEGRLRRPRNEQRHGQRLGRLWPHDTFENRGPELFTQRSKADESRRGFEPVLLLVSHRRPRSTQYVAGAVSTFGYPAPATKPRPRKITLPGSSRFHADDHPVEIVRHAIPPLAMSSLTSCSCQLRLLKVPMAPAISDLVGRAARVSGAAGCETWPIIDSGTGR